MVVMEDKKETEEIQSPDDIQKVLMSIRNIGRKNDEPAKKLLNYLAGKQEWTHEQCMKFYESIICYYLDNEEQQNLILAVSGRLDGYKSLSTAAQCRNTYLENRAKDRDTCDKQVDITDGAIRKQEDKLLGKVAKDLYDDFNNGKIPPLLKLWIPGKQPKIKIFKDSLWKSTNEKPLLWLLSIVNILLFLVYSFFMCLANISLFRQNDTLLKLIGNTTAPKNEAPPIEEITAKTEISLTPGQKKDLELGVSPYDADLADLHCKIDNEDLVAITINWEAVGLGGWLETESDTTIITFWGGEAAPVNVNVIVVKSGNRSNDSDWEYYAELD